jgi:ribosomal protein L40E
LFVYPNSSLTPNFTLPGVAGTQYCGRVRYAKFSATAEQEVTGELTSSVPINFYLMNETQLQDWLSTHLCPVTSTLVRDENIQSYNLDWTSPQNGTYAFVFLNENYTAANVSFSPHTIYPVETYYMIYSTSTIVTSNTISTFNDQLLLLLTTIFVVIVGLEIRSRIESKTKKSGKNFCVECGSELPLKSKFCNNCGTKQP